MIDNWPPIITAVSRIHMEYSIEPAHGPIVHMHYSVLNSWTISFSMHILDPGKEDITSGQVPPFSLRI
jgi:hypothetical protein